MTTIPAGHKLVPIEPTPKMIDATWDHSVDRDGGIESQNTRNRRIYAAMLAAAPAAPAAPVSTVEDADAQKEAVMDAIADALGHAYDCTRVWSAWGVGTMSQDDFHLVTDDAGRLGEIADAAIAAMRPAPAAGDEQDSPAIAALRLALKYWEDRQQRYKNRSPVWVEAARDAIAAQRKGDA